MNKRSLWRFLKTVVVFCLGFPAAIGTGGLAVCWRYGIDPTGIVQAVVTAYTVELGLSCVIRILGGKKKEENQYE